jgi:hypothetical protein
MKKPEAKTTALAALVVILGLPGIAAAENENGRAETTQRAGQDVPVAMKESSPKKPKAGGVILAENSSGKESSLPMLTADVSCHNPCDDKFKLQAWVKEASGR